MKLSPSKSGKSSPTVASQWTVSISELKSAGSHFEVAAYLKAIGVILDTIDASDRARFCKHDYEQALSHLRGNASLWTSSIVREVIALNLKFFNDSHMQRVPTAVLREVLLFLPVQAVAQLGCVCREWLEILRADEIWRPLFHNKFVLSNPACPVPSLPVRPSSSLSVQTCFSSSVLLPSSQGKPAASFFEFYRDRLRDPVVGDKVEVAWRGKFRLETHDVYQGLAWWRAEIVDKHRRKYKIRYPGWDARWDEWVDLSRLRWAVPHDKTETIAVGDVVELWCIGTNVPGAWLEAKVKKIRAEDNMYRLDKVRSSGYLWVEREKLRLVRHGDQCIRKGEPVEEATSAQAMLLATCASRCTVS